VSEILLSNYLGRKLNTLEETKQNWAANQIILRRYWAEKKFL
jgi:hypothetical protein